MTTVEDVLWNVLVVTLVTGAPALIVCAGALLSLRSLSNELQEVAKTLGLVVFVLCSIALGVMLAQRSYMYGADLGLALVLGVLFLSGLATGGTILLVALVAGPLGLVRRKRP